MEVNLAWSQRLIEGNYIYKLSHLHIFCLPRITLYPFSALYSKATLTVCLQRSPFSEVHFTSADASCEQKRLNVLSCSSQEKEN